MIELMGRASASARRRGKRGARARLGPELGRAATALLGWLMREKGRECAAAADQKGRG
jgi:hypothetical protein